MTDQNRPDRICEGDEQIWKKYKNAVRQERKFVPYSVFLGDIVNEGNGSKQAKSLNDEAVRT